ncbi:MAG: 4,5-dioxygenase [Acetobacteraceae bacterium]|nr:4,5-dioxygenase [Acetobacteraceae bacterium]MSP30742.1 4,5-dioxygenase [Acetobacteraceae bacterium]
MAQAALEPTKITGYHAHIYYDPADRARAATLREQVEARFPVRMGRWHDVPVGPHPNAMYQIAFETWQFSLLVPFLMLNRDGLTALVHPETGRSRDDHLLHAIWMGEVLELNASVLKQD